ncbi:hypothetical protein [Gemmiger sp.]
MKKKNLVLGLALAAVFTLAPVSAFADTITYVNGTATHDVTATYNPGEPGGTVHSVDITWGEMAFTYNAASEGTWNPKTHQYDDREGSGNWSASGNTVTVTNHSNTAVTVNLTYTAAEGYDYIHSKFDKDSITLTTAEGTEVTNAPHDTATLTLEGDLRSDVKPSTTVGTITVTLG